MTIFIFPWSMMLNVAFFKKNMLETQDLNIFWSYGDD